MVSWFTAWLTLDEKRISAGQSGVLPCLSQPDFTPGQTGSLLAGWTERLKDLYISCLSSVLYRTVVLLTTLLLLGCGVWGWIQIKLFFDFNLLLPSDSYLRQWIRVHETYYPEAERDTQVYSGHLDQSDLSSIDQLVRGLEDLKEDGSYVREVDCWWPHFKQFTAEKTNLTHWTELGPDFSEVLSDFLFSSYGGQYRASFKFSSELQCGQPAPAITASQFSFSFVTLTTPEATSY